MITFLMPHKPELQSYLKDLGEFRLRGRGRCAVAGATSSSIPPSVPFETAELSAVKTRYAKARSKRCAWPGRPSDQAPPINDRACAVPTTRP